jgi:hypothetical protein
MNKWYNPVPRNPHPRCEPLSISEIYPFRCRVACIHHPGFTRWNPWFLPFIAEASYAA